jgi:hypothetical protein
MFTSWLGVDRVKALAERVAGRSRLAAWQRVQEAVVTLPAAEARGYVRARTISIVKDETLRLIEQEGEAARRRQSQIEDAAIHLLVETITAQSTQMRAIRAMRRAA